MAKDARPDPSPMDESAEAIAQQATIDTRIILESAYQAVKESPGDPDERDNDALSVLAHLAGFCAVHMIARMAETKGVSLNDAYVISVKNIMTRIQDQITGGLMTVGETRQ